MHCYNFNLTLYRENVISVIWFACVFNCDFIGFFLFAVRCSTTSNECNPTNENAKIDTKSCLRSQRATFHFAIHTHNNNNNNREQQETTDLKTKINHSAKLILNIQFSAQMKCASIFGCWFFFFCHFAHLVSCRHFGWHSMSLDSNDKCYLVSDQSQTNKRKSYSLAQEERLKLRYIYNMNDIRQFVVSVWNEIHVKQHQSREI